MARMPAPPASAHDHSCCPAHVCHRRASAMATTCITGPSEYEIQIVAGRKVTQTKPLFSHDVSQVFVASGADVRVYSTETCSFLKKISLPLASQKRLITHLHLHPQFPDTHVVFFTNLGEVVIADIASNDVVFLKDMFRMIDRKTTNTTLQFGRAVVHAAQFKKCRSVLTIYFGIAEDAKIYCFSIEDPVQSPERRRMKRARFDANVHNLKAKWHRGESPPIMSFAPTGTYLTVILGSSLFAQPLPFYDHSRKQKCHLISHETDYMKNITLTCISCHPTEETVATGLTDGRVIIWKDFVNNQKPIRVTYHWHRERVTDVCFSAAGSILYSGGLESTLVSYLLSNGSMTFRSKLGVPIKMITCDEANRRIALQFVDNSMKLVNSDLNMDEDVSMSLSELTFDVFSDHVDRLFYEPNSKSLVMRGSPGQLQFFSLQKMKKIHELDVIIKNYDYSELEKITQMVITAFAVSPDGNWIAASELWDDGVHFHEERLKLYARVGHGYELASVFHLPHEKHITGMKFSPNNRTLITTGNDAMFKIWQLKQRRPGEREYWTSVRSCQRNSVWQPSRVSFSSDSSIAAVQFDELITFWSVDSGVLLTNKWMAAEPAKDRVVGMEFAAGTSSHLFMQAHERNITVWNFLCARKEFEQIIADDDKQSYVSVTMEPNSLRIISLISNGDIVIFKNLCPTEKIVLSAALTQDPILTSYTFVPEAALSEKDGKEPIFLFFDQERQLIALKQNESTKRVQESMEMMETSESPAGVVPFLGQNLFVGVNKVKLSKSSDVKKKKKKTKTPKAEVKEEFDVNKLAHEVFLKHSSQALPRIDLLCKTFMRHLLIQEMPAIPKTEKRKKSLLSVKEEDLTHDSDSTVA